MPRTVTALAAVVTTLLAAPVPPAHAAPGTDRVVLSTGHADLGPRTVDGTWRIQVRDDTTTPPTWRDPDGVVVHAPDAARTSVPPGDGYPFLGPPGAPVWVLPQVQRPELVWLGWNTQDPSVAGTIRRELTWRVHHVTGPGTFVLFLTGNFGAPEVVFDSRKPLPQDSGVEVNTHVHGNWAFTAPGSYLLDVEMSATGLQGQALSGRTTLRMFVGGGDPAAAFAATSPAAPPSAEATRPPATATSSGDPSRRGRWWPAAGVGVLLAAAVTGILLRRRRATR